MLTTPWFRNLFHLIKRNYSKKSPFDFSYSRNKRLYDPFYENSIYGDLPRSKTGGKYYITMVKGIGTGPELMNAIELVFECTNVPVQFDVYDIPSEAPDDEFVDVISSIRRCGACIKGFVEGSQAENPLSRNMIIRDELELYAYLKHFRSYSCIPTTRNANVDLVLVSQNIEGEYKKLEHSPIPTLVESMKIVTRHHTESLAKFTFDIAKRSERNRVLCMILPGITPPLFFETIQEVAQQYPDIDLIISSVKSAIQTIMTTPEKEEVLLSESVVGSLVSTVLYGLVGSRLLVAGCNYGDRYAVFEPAARTRNTEIAGKGIVNPTGALLCGVQLLRYLDLCQYADAIEDAIYKTIQHDHIFTPDVGGNASTKQFLNNVVQIVKAKMGSISQCSFDDPPEIPPTPSEPTRPFDPEIHTDFAKPCGGPDN